MTDKLSNNSNEESPFDEERRNILGKVYLANVRNRLRELEYPNDVDCKRWIWELVQNSKDSIANQQDRKDVDIIIKVEKDIYTFSHNGSPFTIKTLTALLYKYSEGKINNGESTGRFGTGFLTTHSLSKNVKITGDIILKEKDGVQGFSINMYREGGDEELLEGLKKTEKSFKTFKSPGWTTFEYIANTSRNKEAGKLGIQNFKENIAKVMLFCPEINSIELNDNGILFSISRGDLINDISNGCKKLILYQKDGSHNTIRTFIYLYINEFNEELTKKFNKKRNIRICCAVELDKNNNIIFDKNTPGLFCSLPLIGSESFEFPFIINSPDFEPDSERQTIILDGNDISEETGKISEPGINKMILSKAQEMFKIIVKYICSNEINNRYMLLRGLKSAPNISRFFNKEWYEINFMDKMRSILFDFPIVWNGKKYFKLNEINLPMIGYYSDIEERKSAYFFISLLNNYKVPTFEESKIFENVIWKNDNRINYVDIEKCVNFIEKMKNISNLSSKIIFSWNWYDNFLFFIRKYHFQYLEQYAIIPNMLSEFIALTDNLASSKNIPDNMIECLENIKIEWKKNHIHKNLIRYSTGNEHNIDYAILKIQDAIKDNINKALILIEYIPNDEEKGYIEKRNTIYEFCKVVWENQLKEKKDGSGFPKELWDKIDDFIIDKIVRDIEKHKKIEEKYNIDFMIDFLEYFTKINSNYENYNIFPNQNNKFYSLKVLSKDDKIPKKFKDCLKDYFDIDIRDKLLNKKFNFLKLNITKKKIYDYKYILKDKLSSKFIPLINKKEAAICLLSIIPKNIDEDDNQDKNNFNYKQKKLFFLYNIFTNDDLNCVEINRDDENEDIWKYSNPYIYQIITEKIEEYDDVESLSKYIQKSKDKTINLLRAFMNYSNEGRIIPNQNYELCELDDEELFNEGETKKEIIPEELKDISKQLGYDIRKHLVHQQMGRPCSNNISYSYICHKIDSLVKENYKKSSNFSNPNFKSAISSLIEEYFESVGEEKSKIYFPYTYSIKDNIILNVIYDKQARKNMTEFGKHFGIDAAKIFLENPKLVKSIISGKLTDANYKSKIYKNNDDSSDYASDGSENSDFDKSFIINDEENSIKISYNSSLEQKSVNYYKNVFTNIINYGDDFNFGNPINKKVGIMGEAYIYEFLKNSHKYKKVKWNMLSENGYGEELIYNGKIYNVIQDNSHYDILVETYDNKKLYIEVKSTKNKFQKKVPFYLSQKQVEIMESIKPPNKYILAVVFDIFANPKHFFMELTYNLK